MAKKNKPTRNITTTEASESGTFQDSSLYKWIPVIAAFIMFALGAGNAMTGVDDHAATLENPAVKDFSLVTIFSQFNLGMYAPLTWLFYAIANAVGDGSPVAFHLFGAIVHTVNTWLVWQLLEKLDTKRTLIFAITFLFAIHPIQVESVAWIAGFSTPLFSLFYLGAALAYIRYAQSPNQAYKDLGIAILLFIAACLSKSAAVTLPLALIVLNYWRKPLLSIKSQWISYIPFFIIALGFGLLTVYSRQQSGMNVSPNGNLYTLFDRVVVVLFTPIFYWLKILIPLKLNIYYSFNFNNGSFPWYYYAAIPAVLGSIWLSWKYRHSKPYILRGLVFFFANIIVMLPLVSLGTFELCADHYNYLACIGIFYLLVSAWDDLKAKIPALSIVGAIWIIALVPLCFKQVRVWKDMLTVVTNAIDNGYYQNGMMYFARGIEYMDVKPPRPQEAIADFGSALAIDSSMKDAYKFRGSIYARSEQMDLALSDLEKYIKLDPTDVVTWNNLAMIYMRKGKLNASLNAFTKAIELKPDAAISYQNRAKIYEMMGDSTLMRTDLSKAKEVAESKQK